MLLFALAPAFETREAAWKALDPRFEAITGSDDPSEVLSRCLPERLASTAGATVLLVVPLPSADEIPESLSLSQWGNWPAHARVFCLLVSRDGAGPGQSLIDAGRLPASHFFALPQIWNPEAPDEAFSPCFKRFLGDLNTSGRANWKLLQESVGHRPDARHLLQIEREHDAETGLVYLNHLPITLAKPEFTFLFALARMQAEHREDVLYSAERLKLEIDEVFPRFELPTSIKTSGIEHRQAFESHLEGLLAALDPVGMISSGQRWRHLLFSQARRYATGLDHAGRYELMSELRQHRDLLELLIQLYEQRFELPPLNSPAARLYRFFMPEAAALELAQRLHAHVRSRLACVRDSLHEAMQLAGQPVGDKELLWGDPAIDDWEQATESGFALSSQISIALWQAPKPTPKPRTVQRTDAPRGMAVPAGRKTADA
ncbi:MAG: hypothetical protein CVV27_00815 [Candidatus Melainabacteria bacterium HGW-Melainabacteria-1]|nr:MAG: hypothetical protein CVV27_00815 [Candidatus Melainabacteria bacterium HGW-Melainabacteria-1]